MAHYTVPAAGTRKNLDPALDIRLPVTRIPWTKYDKSALDVDWITLTLPSRSSSPPSCCGELELVKGSLTYYLMNRHLTYELDGGSGKTYSPFVLMPREEWLRRLRLVADKLDGADDGKSPEDINSAARLRDFYEQKFAGETSPRSGRRRTP
ncbi:hypothetical protein F5Y17DRAFT_456026 [Xylariaceae sp. FL0594]|nr:hypothetical protein F5Y17DRAFT_456026 [Xylariaceae sp. FL0594]